jgi:hypothetical protein
MVQVSTSGTLSSWANKSWSSGETHMGLVPKAAIFLLPQQSVWIGVVAGRTALVH